METMNEKGSTNSGTNPIQAAERIFSIVEMLAQTGPIGLVELSTRLKLHKSTVHRMLLSLTCMEYVSQEKRTGRYMLTYKLVHLSEMILEKADVIPMVHSFLEELANDCRETVHFVQRKGTEVTYMDKVEPLYPKESAIRMASQIGLTRPLYSSAVGKAILAEMSEDEVAYIWEHSEIKRNTEHTITSLEELRKDLILVRKRGYALDNEENEPGVFCIAASIKNHKGKADYAISISAPVSRMPEKIVEEMSDRIIRTKLEIQKVL